jgi:hypothetical protein
VDTIIVVGDGGLYRALSSPLPIHSYSRVIGNTHFQLESENAFSLKGELQRAVSQVT